MNGIRLLALTMCLMVVFGSFAQKSKETDQQQQLALQYYRSGELDKAVVLYEELFEKSPNSSYYYRYYLFCLSGLEDYKTAEKVVKKQIKRQPNNASYLVDYGYLFSLQDKQDKAIEYYEQALSSVGAKKHEVLNLANSFTSIRAYQFAEKVYKKGLQILPQESTQLVRNLGHLYKTIGDKPNMVSAYLDYIDLAPSQQEYVKGVFQDELLEPADLRMLEGKLYERVQNAQRPVYHEMLVWLLIRVEDYGEALLQVKAIDRRFKEHGQRIFNLGHMLLEEKAYDEAMEAFQTLVERGKNGRYYFYAKEGFLKTRKLSITDGYQFEQSEVEALEKDYLNFIAEFALRDETEIKTLRELAHLEAFYLHQLDKAINLLEPLLEERLERKVESEVKLDLGDYYIMTGDVWEATLLYGQVDKKMKDAPEGEKARFKNAVLSYYKGEFEWAQGQLDVLKASTSELIANDALDLSVFISDHYSLDTTAQPMQWYADAELLVYQQRFDLAEEKLDSIMITYPEHSLEDDIYFLKAEMLLQRQQIDSAVTLLEKLVDTKGESILLDDAIFKLAELNELELKNEERAKELYEKLILEHKGSIFVVEARKRFRKLRGDNI